MLPARITFCTLACRDVERMARLLRRLGWPETPASDEHHRTFQRTNGVAVDFYDARHYAAGFGPPADGFRGTTLCVNVASFAECVAIHDQLREVPDVELLEPPTEAAWGGGFSWRDPEGTVGDVAWAKEATLGRDGAITFP